MFANEMPEGTFAKNDLTMLRGKITRDAICNIDIGPN
jgi:hypothetical protein